MSDAVRAEIAEVCNTVEGVRVSKYYRQEVRAGNGVVMFAGLARPNRLGGVITWQVAIFLPSGIADGERFIETKAMAVLDALTARRVFRDGLRVTPDQLVLEDGTTVPVVVIEGKREED